jgi:hypothetical protein
MFNHTEILKRVFGDALPVSTSADLVQSFGVPALSMTLQELKAYHKRSDGLTDKEFHQVYRSCGVYCIEFPRGIYVGSVGGGSQYFGRRWKQHVSYPRPCYAEDIRTGNPSDIRFHALAITVEDIPSRFLEFMFMARVEAVAPSLLLNPKNAMDKPLKEIKAMRRAEKVLRGIQWDMGLHDCPVFE